MFWRRFVKKFVGWGYPAYWPLVTYPLKIVAGIMIFFPATKLIGLGLSVVICVAAIATLVVQGDRAEYKAIPVNIVLIMLAAIGIGWRGH